MIGGHFVDAGFKSARIRMKGFVGEVSQTPPHRANGNSGTPERDGTGARDGTPDSERVTDRFPERTPPSYPGGDGYQGTPKFPPAPMAMAAKVTAEDAPAAPLP